MIGRMIGLGIVLRAFLNNFINHFIFSHQSKSKDFASRMPECSSVPMIIPLQFIN